MCRGCMTCVAERYRNQSLTQSRAMTTKQCLSCGSSFVVNETRNAHDYCSRSCRQKYRSKNLKIRKQLQVKCLHCQTLITCWDSNPRKYCSNQCNYRHRVTMGVPAKRSLRQSLKKYSLSDSDWHDLLNHQESKCAICRKLPTAKINGRIKRLAIDHCHETGKVRGLLCHECNAGLGMFGDNWMLLDNAIEYLSYWHGKHNSSKTTVFQESPILN